MESADKPSNDNRFFAESLRSPRLGIAREDVALVVQGMRLMGVKNTDISRVLFDAAISATMNKELDRDAGGFDQFICIYNQLLSFRTEIVGLLNDIERDILPNVGDSWPPSSAGEI